MSWIKMIPFEEASGRLKSIYQKVKGPNNKVDNVLRIHSLRPHTLTGHMALYKNVLHNSNNSLPKWYLETIGVYVSYLNKCDYCVAHHYEGLKRLLQNDFKAEEIFDALKNNTISTVLEQHYTEGLQYSKVLTTAMDTLTKNNIDTLLEVGFTEGEVLEINQVTSYFNYANRTVNGLGVTTQGDILGLSPNDSDDPNNWSHK